MPEEIVMPRLSDTMEEGTIAQWLKREGETVRKGEAILEVETDKATMELQAYSDGIIQQIIQGDGSTVPVGAVVGLLAKIGEMTLSSSAGHVSSSAAHVEAAPGPTVQPPAPPAQSRATAPPIGSPSAPSSLAVRANGPAAADDSAHDGRLKASPLARRLAEENHINLESLNGRGSGPGGRIVQQDIEQYLAQSARGVAVATSPLSVVPPGVAAAAEPAVAAGPSLGEDAELRRANRIQQVMARRLLESKTTIPHFYVTNEVDMAAAAELRKQLQATYGEDGRVTYNDLVVRACALALRTMPEVNASWRDGQFAIHSHVNVGVAVGIPDGLLVPVIRDADRKGLRELAVEARTLADKARSGKLSLSEMEGGTFTVSNLGMFDVEEFQAIINPPESAILAVSSIVEKPVVMDGAVAPRLRMRLSLSADHRVIPGVPAAKFLQLVKLHLQEPLRLAF